MNVVTYVVENVDDDNEWKNASVKLSNQGFLDLDGLLGRVCSIKSDRIASFGLVKAVASILDSDLVHVLDVLQVRHSLQAESKESWVIVQSES